MMARPKKDTGTLTIALTNSVLEVLEKDSNTFGISKGAYISQLIMQKHMEMLATGLLDKLTPEQIQTVLEDVKKT